MIILYIFFGILLLSSASALLGEYLKKKANDKALKHSIERGPKVYHGVELPMRIIGNTYTVDSMKLLREDPVLWTEWKLDSGTPIKDILYVISIQINESSDNTRIAILRDIENSLKSYNRINDILFFKGNIMCNAMKELANSKTQEEADIANEKYQNSIQEYRQAINNYQLPPELKNDDVVRKILFIHSCDGRKDFRALLQLLQITPLWLIKQ